MIRDIEFKDLKQIADIYNHYIRNTVITFEEEEICSKDMEIRVEKIKSLGLPWIVLELDSKVLGYAYASKWHERSAYRFAVETTVYLDPNCKGQGYGTLLYNELFNELRKLDIKSAIGCIRVPNEQSVKLHEKIGMKKVGHFEKVGFKFDEWQDVGYWQMFL